MIRHFVQAAVFTALAVLASAAPATSKVRFHHLMKRGTHFHGEVGQIHCGDSDTWKTANTASWEQGPVQGAQSKQFLLANERYVKFKKAYNTSPPKVQLTIVGVEATKYDNHNYGVDVKNGDVTVNGFTLRCLTASKWYRIHDMVVEWSSMGDDAGYQDIPGYTNKQDRD